MKVLLDECLPLDLRHYLDKHEAHTVQWAGFKGKKNSDLMRSAEAAGYDVLITVDQGLRHQLPVGCEKLSIVMLRVRTNQIEDLLPLTELILETLDSIQPREVIAIP